MEDNRLSYFVLGLGVGVAAGLLFAPKSGAETRDLILTKADESKEYLRRRSEELRDSASDAIEKGKSAVAKQREQLTSAIEAGKQAYRDAISQTGSQNSATEGV
jgi:gas vesicle protein